MTTPIRRSYSRYVAIGDSSTEGLDDPDGHGGYRGWANRLALHVANAQDVPLLYANLAIRGRTTPAVHAEQLTPALTMRPDLVTVFSGVNDIVRRRYDADDVVWHMHEMFLAFIDAGATVLTITMPDLSEVAPIARLVQRRLLDLNARVRAVCAQTGVHCVDLANVPVTRDLRLWSGDRLHANSQGHARIAEALAQALGLPGHDAWAVPLPSAPSPTLVRRIGGEVRWVGEHFAPWVWRHARGISSGDGRQPKRPVLQLVHADNV